MNIIKAIMDFKVGFTTAINNGLEIEAIKRWVRQSGLGYFSTHIGNTVDDGIPVFIADEFVYVNSGIKDIPAAYAVIIGDTKEIYINKAFKRLSTPHQKAFIAHEVGHLALGAVYSGIDKLLAQFGLSNKTYLCECAADDYALAGGHDILGALLVMRDTYGVKSLELNKRIARLSDISHHRL